MSARRNPVWIRPEGSLQAREMESQYDLAYDNPSEDGTGAMAMHASLIGLAGYGVMTYIIKQDSETALKRSAALAVGAFLYMGIFGHGPPTEARGPFFSKG